MKIHEYQGKEILRQFSACRCRAVPGLHGAGSHRSGAEAGRPGLGGEGADPRRRPRQGGGVKVAKTLDDQDARPDPGHAAEDAPDRPRGPEGAPPLVGEGATSSPRATTSRWSPTAPRRRSRSSPPAKAAWTSRKWRTDAREDHHRRFDRSRSPGLAARRPEGRAAIGLPGPPHQRGGDAVQEPVPLLHGDGRPLVEINPLILTATGNLNRAGRQVQLRRNALFRHPRSSPTATSTKRIRRDRGQQVRPRLHPARRQHRLPGQRRRPRDGDHGHHQAVRRRAGQLPRRRRRRHRREGDRGLQDHAVQNPKVKGHPGQHLRRHHALRHHRRRA